ncbi:Transketolase [Bienertia sinuspersici]
MEALAARKALSIAMEAGLRKVILETDNLTLFQCLAKKRVECSAFGVIVKDILRLAKNCNYIAFSHVKREGNKVAHNLAKMSGNFEDLQVWMEEVLDRPVSKNSGPQF